MRSKKKFRSFLRANGANEKEQKKKKDTTRKSSTTFPEERQWATDERGSIAEVQNSSR